MQTAKKDFLLIPWEEDFLTNLFDYCSLNTENLQDLVFIFPHARPARYLEKIIAEDSKIKKPCLLPKMLAIHSLFQAIFTQTFNPRITLSLLDQVGILLNNVRSLQGSDANLGLYKLLSSNANVPLRSNNTNDTNDTKVFFPWGIRLANLFEECFLNYSLPQNILYPSQDLAPFAQDLLSNLNKISSLYIQNLEENNWTTAAYTVFKTAESLNNNQVNFPSFINKQAKIIIAGFASPSPTENILFKHLWENYNCEIVVHADQALIDKNEHWSCKQISTWSKSWKCNFNLLPNLQSQNKKAPKITYYSAYDVHSQLNILQSRITEEQDKLQNTAIILPDTGLLMPTLHSMPVKDLNVSMGYPLAHSPLAQLLEHVLLLQEKKRGANYYQQDIIQLIRHPYIKMLSANLDEKNRELWRVFFQELNNLLHSGKSYLDCQELLKLSYAELENLDPAPQLLALIEEFYLTFFKNWENIQNLFELSKALRELTEFLLHKGEHLWSKFLIDAECLYRLKQILIPALGNTVFQHEELNQGTIFAILRELINAERVPFDAYPLTSLQIMGLLESRLLSFKDIYILNATDDLLPGKSNNNQLLPEGLRGDLNLPNFNQKQDLIAYYFFRLLQSAQNVHILWQEGLKNKGIQDAKSIKSRFVEELLWLEERKRKKLFEPVSSGNENLLTDGSLNIINCKVTPVSTSNGKIKESATMKTVKDKLLSSPLSATIINQFLRCPLAFYYKNIAQLEEMPEFNEDYDPLAMGSIIHEAFRITYQNYVGLELKNTELSVKDFMQSFESALNLSDYKNFIPLDVLAALRVILPVRFKNYLKQQPATTNIQALEVEAIAELKTTKGETFKLKGYIDRIDKREFIIDITADNLNFGYVILDYKTGIIAQQKQDFCSKIKLWEDKLKNFILALNDRDFQDDKDFFEELTTNFSDLQLPFYMYLARHGKLQLGKKSIVADHFFSAGDLINAGWLELRNSGSEIFLLPSDLNEKQLTELLDEHIPLLLEAVLLYMQNTNEYQAKAGAYCAYCSYSKLCIRSKT